MKQAIYPGSFDPFHSGHRDIVDKAIQVFDHVCIARGINPDKLDLFVDTQSRVTHFQKMLEPLRYVYGERVSFLVFDSLLVDIVRAKGFHAVVRGIRNGEDLEFEKKHLYYNEDLGMTVPTVHFITDRKYAHVSSSELRMLQPFLDRRKK